MYLNSNVRFIYLPMTDDFLTQIVGGDGEDEAFDDLEEETDDLDLDDEEGEEGDKEEGADDGDDDEDPMETE